VEQVQDAGAVGEQGVDHGTPVIVPVWAGTSIGPGAQFMMHSLISRHAATRATITTARRATAALAFAAGSLGAQAAFTAPSPDPRIGLRAGLQTAGEAAWNLTRVATVAPPEKFVGATNSDLAFTGKYAIQGSYNGWQIWDISTPSKPTLVTAYYCPASQSDVSVYKNLLFISGEGLEGRLDCGDKPDEARVSTNRLRGLRIFDISDIRNPKNVGNVQTCRGSHTHTVLADPKDKENVYVYISGSSDVRPSEELAGCSGAQPEQDPNSALFRIEVIKVPLADPSKAAIVSSPRIFNDLAAPPRHGQSAADKAEVEKARAAGKFVFEIAAIGETIVLPDEQASQILGQIMKQRGGTGAPTAADSATLRMFINRQIEGMGGDSKKGPTQCHDITVYPGIGLAGGACEGYGLLLDISDPANPKRVAAVADSNFSYWHSATFNNDGTKVLFTDEWGGGGAPKCRSTDPMTWGADAIFTLSPSRQLTFAGYFKMPAAQTAAENCVAHNGSMIPVPGRDIMVQAWYQGGISIFDWTNPAKVTEIAYHDRGPVDSTRMEMGGSWSVYWYNGVIVSSEIARGLDVFELTTSPMLSANELAAAKTVQLEYLNAQGQPKYVWPPSFAKAQAFVDQLERSNGLSAARITAVRSALTSAEQAKGAARTTALRAVARSLAADASGSSDAAKVTMLRDAVQELATAR
jgi:LVIVD repeat